MIDYLTANAGTITVAALLTVTVFLAVRAIVRKKKNGQCSCGCKCGSCAMSGTCHKK